jgi:two-component system OmpR family sensor kinase
MTEDPTIRLPARIAAAGLRTELRTGSLRRRVTLSVLAALLVLIIGLIVLVDALFTVQSNRDVNSLLTSYQRSAVVQATPITATPAALLRRVDTGVVRARLVLTDGETLGTLSGSDKVDARTSRTVTLSSRNKRLDGAQLTLDVQTSVLSAPQARLRRLLLVVGLGALAVTAIVVVLVVRFALVPLDTMAGLARSIAGGDRGRRLAPTRPDTELGRTAAAFDDMVDALEGTERQARDAEAVARASEERTRRFVADAAHELRTPIAGVQAVAEAVLHQSPDADPEERQRLELLLVRETRRAGALVDDLLDLARIDAGVELNLSSIALHTLAEGEADRARLLGPELTVEVTGVPVTVPADPVRVTQIVANLMDNARQATPPTGRIRLHTAVSGSHAEFTVLDSGYGVAAADRERIFDRLVRLDAARDRRSGGSGLGLAIARGFARAHGGDLRCEAPPAGSTGALFRLVLPLGQDADTVRKGSLIG